MTQSKTLFGAAFLAVVWAQCPVIDLSTVSGNAVVESFETYPLNAPPPGPCYDTLWIPTNSSLRDTNGWYVRSLPSDLTGIGSGIGTKALRISYLEYAYPAETTTVLLGPSFQLVPLRKYRLAYMWAWRDDPSTFQGVFPNHIYYLEWFMLNSSDTLEIGRDTLGTDALYLAGLSSRPTFVPRYFYMPSTFSSSPLRLVVSAKVETDVMPSFLFIDSVAVAQVPNDLAYVLNATYSGSGISSITVISHDTSSSQNDTILITLPCDMPLSNVTGYSVQLTPGATLNPSSIDGDYNNPTRSRTFSITSEDGNRTRTLVVIVTPRYTPVVTISAGGSNGADLSVNNPNANHSYQWQFSSNGTTWNDISGATGATYTATQNGHYRVAVDSAGCVGYSNAIHITTLALSRSQGRVIIHPNPVSSFLTIQALSPIRTATLHTLEGRVIRTWKAEGKNLLTLDLTEVPAGVYLLKVETGEGILHHRIQKVN